MYTPDHRSSTTIFVAAACDFVSGGMVAYDRDVNHDNAQRDPDSMSKDNLLLGEQFEGVKTGEAKNG
jgi:hypothetical protein